MKSKYHGIVSLLIFVIAVAAMIGYGLFQSNRIKGSVRIASPQVVPQVMVPEPATLKYIDFLTQRLPMIAHMKEEPGQVDLRLFGKSAAPENQSGEPQQEQSRPDRPATETATRERASYRLTLCFSSPQKSFCVIDGQMYEEEALLPDGSKIVKIENDRVRIGRNNRSEWVWASPGAKGYNRENGGAR